MELIRVNEQFSVSGPITTDIATALDKIGVGLLLNVRPDEETTGMAQPDWAQLAVQHYWQYAYLPVTSGQYSWQTVQRFGEIVQSQTRPVHAFCRTGTRALHLWLLLQAMNGSPQSKIDGLARQFYVTSPVLTPTSGTGDLHNQINQTV